MEIPIPKPARRRFVPIWTPHNEKFFAKHKGELIGKRELMLHEKHVVTAALDVDHIEINILAMTGGAGWFETGLENVKDNLYHIVFTSVWYINDDGEVMEIPIVEESIIKTPHGPLDTLYTIKTAEAGQISFDVNITSGLLQVLPFMGCKIKAYSVEIQRYAFDTSWHS